MEQVPNRKVEDQLGHKIELGQIIFIPVIVRSIRPDSSYDNLDVSTLFPFYPAPNFKNFSINSRQTFFSGEFVSENENEYTSVPQESDEYNSTVETKTPEELKAFLKDVKKRNVLKAEEETEETQPSEEATSEDNTIYD